MAMDLSREVILRWEEPEPSHAPLLTQGGITAVLLPAPSAGVSNPGLKTVLAGEVQFVNWAKIESAAPGRPAVLTDGLWPGVSRQPSVRDRGDETASASREPWVDADGYWVGCLRALYPDRPAVLGYQPPTGRILRYESLELALIDAWVSGGNYLLSLWPEYRKALLAGDNEAMAAWRQLGRTSLWLRENLALFRQPVFPTVVALVEPGGRTPEIANLLYRRSASPSLAPAHSPLPPAPERTLALVAAGLKPPSPEVRAAILRHAEAGATVIADAPWCRDPRLKLAHAGEDREFYALGRGQVLIYKKPVVDPSEFALDVIDVVTHKRRAVRLWNAPAVIPLATSRPQGGALLHVINYGSPIRGETMARIQGVFAKATLLRPEVAPAPLKVAKRGSTTEVEIPDIRRLAVIMFDKL